MYYGTLIQFVGGPTSDEILEQDIGRQMNGKAQMWLRFDIRSFMESKKACSCFCFAPWNINPEERILPTHAATEEVQPTIAAKEPAESSKYHLKSNIWRLSGYIGVLKHKDGYMHELFLGEYDAARKDGTAVLLLEEESMRRVKTQYPNAQLTEFPYDENFVKENLPHWSFFSACSIPFRT